MPPPTPFWLYLILHLFLHPFTVSSGRAQGGPALAAFWARVREATGSSSAGPMKTLLATSFARALSELPAEKVRTCWAALAKAFPSDNTDHATLLLEAKANRDRLFPSGAMPEPTETEAEAQANAEAEAEEGGVHEAEMDEPEGAEPTAEEYNAFFDAIMAMP